MGSNRPTAVQGNLKVTQRDTITRWEMLRLNSQTVVLLMVSTTTRTGGQVLYPKFDGVPTHWPRQVSCLTLHVSTHPCKLSGEEQTSTIEGMSPEELTPNEQGSCSPSAGRGCTPSASNPPQGSTSALPEGCPPSASRIPRGDSPSTCQSFP